MTRLEHIMEDLAVLRYMASGLKHQPVRHRNEEQMFAPNPGYGTSLGSTITYTTGPAYTYQTGTATLTTSGTSAAYTNVGNLTA